MYQIYPLKFSKTGNNIKSRTQLSSHKFDDIEICTLAYNHQGKISEVNFGLLDFLINLYTFLCAFPEFEDDIVKQLLLPSSEYGYNFKLNKGNLIFMGLDDTYIGEAIFSNVMRDVIILVKKETLKAVNEGRLDGGQLPLLKICTRLNTNY